MLALVMGEISIGFDSSQPEFSLSQGPGVYDRVFVPEEMLVVLEGMEGIQRQLRFYFFPVGVRLL